MTRVALCNVNPGMVTARYMESVLHSFLAQASLELELGYLHSFGIYIPELREGLANEFLGCEEPFDWMLTVDSDIRFEPSDVKTLVDAGEGHGLDVVGGLYLSSWSDGVGPVAWHGEPPLDPRFSMDDVDGHIHEVGAIGTGFLLVRRQAVESVKERYGRVFDTAYEDDASGKRVFLGEDILFCRRLRELGYPVHLHTGVRVGHEKGVMLGA